jgi:SAM-dependent methyltransferase
VEGYASRSYRRALRSALILPAPSNRRRPPFVGAQLPAEVAEVTLPSPSSVPADDLPILHELVRAIRIGRRPPDFMFDRFLPLELRLVSGQHWTPVDVAMRTAEWLSEFRIKSVLDVGSGSGKFCVLAALAGDAWFVGIEQRARLVRAARELAQQFGVSDRVEFIQAEFSDSSAPAAEAYYLFNPFGENLYGTCGQLDDQVELGGRRYRRDVAAVERLLAAAPAGTFVVTYNGFGGHLPNGYELLRVDRELPNVLSMWRKRKRGPHRSVAGRGQLASPPA